MTPGKKTSKNNLLSMDKMCDKDNPSVAEITAAIFTDALDAGFNFLKKYGSSWISVGEKHPHLQ